MKVIDVPFTGDPQHVVDKAKAAAHKHGGEFSGDRFAGKFSGNGISGHYRFTETVVVVTIENKPDFAPWPMVETAIRGFFESEPAPKVDGPKKIDGAARRMVADRIIRKHVLWASGAGLIPIPLADIAAVTGVQVSMLQELAKLYEVQLSDPILKNFASALTGGMAARIGASVFKAIPGIGTFLGGASMSIMSGASTYAVGQVGRGEFETGGGLANIDMKRAKSAYDKAFEKGKELVGKLSKSDADPPK